MSGRALPRLALALAAALCACGEPRRPGLPPKHLLLVTIDGLRADHTSAFMYHRATTGNLQAKHKALELTIDGLASGGVLSANAYSPQAETAPALASLFTGLAPLETGLVAETDALDPAAVTLAEHLRDAGFLTVAFVSQPDVDVKRAGLDQGFDLLVQRAEDLQTLLAASQWIEVQDFDNDRAVFLWLHLSGPAPPFDPRAIAGPQGAEEFAKLYADPRYAGSADGSLEHLERARRGEVELTAADREQLVALYDGEVLRATSVLRKFLDYLMFYVGFPSDMRARTLVAVAGTYGMELGEHGSYFGARGSLHEVALRVPLILNHADSLTGSRVMREIVELADLCPTLLEWFELPVPDGLRGRTLLPLVDSYRERPFERRPAYAIAPDRRASLRDPRWRLIWSPAPERVDDGVEPARLAYAERELYDTAADPLETDDVAARESETALGLERELRAWLSSLRLHPRCASWRELAER
jgi:arylsulfatase A-like enzyme